MKCKLYPYKRKDIASVQELKQVAGWQITSFNIPETWSYSEGEGVTIAVLDTGCDLDHPDLKDNLLDGYNVLSPRSLPDDDNSHGTHVAGCICAKNNEIGVVGVAPSAKVVPIKVLDKSGSGNMEDIARGVRIAIERNVDMMCLSIGCAKPFGPLRKAIKAASDEGIPVFCAGGNIGKDYDVLYPARYPETIAVAAIDKTFNRAKFSNTAKNNLDFLAPGVDILSTVVDGWYALFSGSSMAAPFAVGVASLMLAARKKGKTRIVLDTVEDYREILRKHGANLGKFTGDKLFAGYGIIEPDKLIEWVSSQSFLLN